MPRAIPSYEFDRRIAAGSALSSLDLPGLSSPLPPSVPSVILAGADEVVRGPLAGPVVAAAVILPESPQIVGLRDSKIIPREQREALYCEIEGTALASAVAVVEADVIDATNILAASLQAMRQAIRELNPLPGLVIVDGNQRPGSGIKEMAIVKGDSLSACIMAASIFAKVARDHIMQELHELYPVYGFDLHKGYSCRSHLEALRKYGPSPVHRMSFDPVRQATGAALLPCLRWPRPTKSW